MSRGFGVLSIELYFYHSLIMNTKSLKQLFSAFLISGSLMAQELKTITFDDGTIKDATEVYSFIKDVNSSKLLSPMACASGSNLVTFYATNNAQRGHMFDINATNCVTIMCFEMNFSAGTSNVEIYTKAGTHVGFTTTSAAWTLIGTALNVASAGVNVPTSIPITVNQLIPSGSTRAFYITRTTLSGPTVAYTNGTAVGNVLAADANITLREGTGKEYPFSTDFTPRQFNGRVFYTVNPPCVLPIELSSFNVYQKGNAVNLNWTTASESNNDYFTIERSTNLEQFEALAQVPGSGNSYTSKSYAYTDKQPLKGLAYYRIKNTDKNGKFNYSEVKAIGYEHNLMSVAVNPVPAQKNISVSFTAIEKMNYALSIYNAEGRLMLTKNLEAENGTNDNSIDISELPPGIYQLMLSNDHELERTKFVKE
jgi:hypothetical protein